MDENEIKKVADSYRTFDMMYDALEKNNFNPIGILSRELGTNEYPEITWLMEYFLSIEDYDKCEKLKNIIIIPIDRKKLNIEKMWLYNHTIK
jgi:hypothetical protein